MSKLVCEVCNGSDLVKQGNVFVCQSCGAKYNVEEAKLLIKNEVASQPELNSSNELDNLYEVAKRAANIGDYSNAAKYYEQILVKDPSSWQANFYSVYYKAMGCKLSEICQYASQVTLGLQTVFNLVKNQSYEDGKQKETVVLIASELIVLETTLFNAFKSYYEKIRDLVKDGFTHEDVSSCLACKEIGYVAGNLILEIFGESYGDLAAHCWELGVEHHVTVIDLLQYGQQHADIITSYNEKISKYDPSYRLIIPRISSSSGKCYIATAVYGSYDCPQVWVLRRFRDNVLAHTGIGRGFIKAYYRISPWLVKHYANISWIKTVWRHMLDALVSRLRRQGIQDTRYIDRNTFL